VNDRGVLARCPSLVLVLVHLEPGRVFVHDERGDALVTLLRVAGGEDHEEAGEARVGDPGFCSVSTYSSPCFSKRVLMPATSLPAPGSVVA